MPTDYGVYPQAHELVQDDEQRTITVRNPFYSITHSLDRGGTISDVRCHRGSDRNLLMGPCSGNVRLADGAVCSADHDHQSQVSVDREGDDLILTFEGLLRDSEGRDCGIAYRDVYRHRWGHVRIDKRLRFSSAMRVSGLCVHSWVVRPELTHFGIRPGATQEPSTWTGAFGVCRWGRFSPGSAFDTPWQSRFVPRYVCCANPGREGIEWFVGSDLSQWDYQLAAAPGHGSFNLAPQTQPPAVALSVCPLDVPRGGVTLSGDYTFRAYLGVPIISGQANKLFLHRSFNRKNWPGEEQIKAWADGGVGSIHFHHDGDSFRDGLFWRDGAYPPFEPEDMARYDRVIADCHRHGIRVATYFSNKELHPTVPAYEQSGAQWARLPDSTWEQLHNAYSGDEYGAQMCLRSGWADFHKEYIDKVLSHHDLDGTYYDWNAALYCHNTRHVAGREKDEQVAGIGDWAHSPAGHWDMDELLDLMAWTRRRVGSDGLMIIHNTMVPMAATENYADSVVAMEWGYAKLASGAPAIDDLPLEWNFMGHRARGVIGYGCLEKDAPERVHRQMTLRAILTGVAPWPALDPDIAMFAPLAGLDLTEFRFDDPRSAVARTDLAGVPAAVYHRPEEALILVGSVDCEQRTVRCSLDLGRCDLGPAQEYIVEQAGVQTCLSAEQLGKEGVQVQVPADAVASVSIRPR